jgi:TolB-like protein
VRYVLEGSVRRIGTMVRISAQLIATESSAHVWAERFDKPLASLGEGGRYRRTYLPRSA